MTAAQSRFAPIAIVGRGCVLPGALDPDAFWENILAGRESISQVPDSRWRLLRKHAMGTSEDCADRTWTDLGGYVRGFDSVFDPAGFALDPDLIGELDPGFQWTLHGAREALRESGQARLAPRTGLVLGNLSYPSASAVRYAEQVWLGAQREDVRDALLTAAGSDRPDPRNRFCSGLPAQLTARALGLGGGAFALDAACASSLYAIKLACDRLHDQQADLMIAGGVNATDNLLIHAGFCALEAMSRTGRSRPFHRDADGLLPAEGAALVALMRLPDALAAGTPILGVIRGIGLANDGRGAGPLSPAPRGQMLAMMLAYQVADLPPHSVSLAECHATGTAVGDAVEIQSMTSVFGGCADLPIGSVKSNVGHLVTAAGAAGLLKVLGAMRTGVRPPTLNAQEPLDALAGTPLRVLQSAEEWPGLRRAAISGFGFGGNNAHLIVDAWEPAQRRPVFHVPAGGGEAPPIAVVALGVRTGDTRCTADFVNALMRGQPCLEPSTTVEVALAGLRVPPRDLESSLGQQVLMLETAREAMAHLILPVQQTMVLIGMGCDLQGARTAARTRVPGWLELAGADPAQAARCQEAFGPELSAAIVVGRMPNLVANRISAQFDIQGPAYTVSAEEASGLVAIDLAARALREYETDAALVGAVDLSAEPVHQAALRELGQQRTAGDAAVVFVLKRLKDARRDGDRVLALVEDTSAAAPDLLIGDDEDAQFDPARQFGSAHAATGLLSLAAAVFALHHRALPRQGAPATPALGARTAEAVATPLEAAPARVRLRRVDTAPWIVGPPTHPRLYSGKDRQEVLTALRAGHRSADGPARLATISDAAGSDVAQPLTGHLSTAARWLDEGGVRPDGAAFREAPIIGEIGFVYTNGSAAYPGMGWELLHAFPEAADTVTARYGPLRRLLDSGADDDHAYPRDVLGQILGAGALSALHTELTRGLLGLHPAAAIGYSSGESAALLSLGAWTDPVSFAADARACGLFTQELGGELRAIRRVWARLGVRGKHWASYLVNTSADQARTVLAGQSAVHLLAINAPDLCVIGGEEEACAAVVAGLGSGQAVRIDYELTAHLPELDDIRDRHRELHRRPTRPVPGVRFYTAATCGSYSPTWQQAAEAITEQALRTIDFVTTIEQAWADGVRVFIEHGPRGLCTGWIRKILAGREHLAVALDTPGKGLRQLCHAVAELMAAGVPVQAAAFFDHLAAASPGTAQPPSGPATLPIPAHPPEIHLPELEFPVTAMERLSDAAARPAGLEITPLQTATPPAHPVLVSVVEQQRRVHELHRSFLSMQADFVAAQAEVHRRVLQVRQRADTAATLTGARLPGLPAPSPPALPKQAQPGPAFDRDQLTRLATGKISELFGPLFAAQDAYHRQTRLPAPPLLLVDRVTGIDAEPASMGIGTLWTETDIRPDSWYLDAAGRMPAGILVESGQADLLLISWLGIDLLTKGERVYRLLGCDLRFHGTPPQPGETLRHQISVDDHAEHEGVRLFFFHSQCQVAGEPRLTISNGQAGFFTDQELADPSGVLWDPATSPPRHDVPHDPPVISTGVRSFDTAAVRAFAAGHPADCFGPAWEATRAHVRSPRIDQGRLLLLGEVTELDPGGGPWGRGYLRAETQIMPDDWFFTGHFTNDPCMPGTLMAQGGLQAMAFYLAAMGFTLERDGWRFEPVPDQTFQLRCRSQVTPTNHRLTYEVFVSGMSAEPYPTLFADVLCTADGVGALHAAGLELRLVPDWPLNHWRQLRTPAVQITGDPVPLGTLGGLLDHHDTGPVAEVEGVQYGYPTILAAAWGRPSEAFGTTFSDFDGPRRMARLPGPPYLFMTRATSMEKGPGGGEVGSRIEVDYEVPDDVWYFEQNGRYMMPFCAIVEAILQPCGSLAVHIGSTLGTGTDVTFRNLGGDVRVYREVDPDTQALHTRAVLRSHAQLDGMIVQTFDVESHADGELLLSGSATFGFFPAEALRDQVGLPPSAAERSLLAAPSDYLVDLGERPARFCGGPLRLAGPMLLMIDRVTGYWPDGGSAGLGRLRAEKDVDAGEWFFKSHFFQDPVQPGSLGLEAMCQLMQFYMIERGMGTGIPHPRFEPVMRELPLTWTYRGQVLPTDHRVTIELDVLQTGADEQGRFVTAEAWLWVDGRRIYHAQSIGMRICPGSESGRSPAVAGDRLDPLVDTWLLDHRPTWTVPVLPMMSTANRLAQAAADYTGREVNAVDDLRLLRWLPLPGPVRVRTKVEPSSDKLRVSLIACQETATRESSRWEPVATATVMTGRPVRSSPAALSALAGSSPEPSPYETGIVFHGPSFHYLVSLQMGSTGSSATLDPDRGAVPRGLLHQGLLDAALHAIPHDRLWLWAPEISHDLAGFPHRLVTLELFGPLPAHDRVNVEARFAGFDDSDHTRPLIDVQIQAGGRVLATFRVAETLLPLGVFAKAAAKDRRVFLRDRRYANGLGISTADGHDTKLSATEVETYDWLPGTVAHIYGLPPGAHGRDHLAEIAIKDHVGRLRQVHPSAVEVAEELHMAHLTTAPQTPHLVDVSEKNGAVRVWSVDVS
jgi:acyl transferase domain-containing protein